MPVPDFQTLLLPVLTSTSDGMEHRTSDIVNRMSDEFELTADERSELLPSGRQARMTNRVHWAITYLARTKLLERTRHGYVRITDRGRTTVGENLPRIDLAYLDRFPELAEFRGGGESSTEVEQPSQVASTATPDERLRAAHSEIVASLKSELLARVMAQSPLFFERLVVELLVAMGFGGTHGKAAQLGGAGDGGVDGVVDQDALGLDRVYVQAKRWQGNPVGPGQIRDFFGSLDAMKASKGVFITTSKFTSDARETAERLTKRIVLIDGEALADLMVRYSVGTRTEETVEIKKVDEDFFIE